MADANHARRRHPDHAYFGQLERDTASVGRAEPKAKWLPGDDLRAVFAGWLWIDGGVPYRTDGRNGLRAGHLVRNRIGLVRAGRSHNCRSNPNHTNTCQREPEAAPRSAIAESGMDVSVRGHGDTPTNP